MTQSRHALGLALATALVVGCARPPGQVPEGVQIEAPHYQFPARTDIERLANSRAELPQAPTAVTLGQWTLEASELSPPGHSEFFQSVIQEETRFSHSASLSCAAREWARVHHQFKKVPDDRARRYFVLRCGGTNPNVQAFLLAGQADPRQTDAELLARIKPSLSPAFSSSPKGDVDVGFALFRHDLDFVAAVTLARRTVTLAPVTRVLGPEPHVTVRGRLEEPAPSALALANQGEYGVATCQADPSVRLPEFVFRCPIRSEDERVWIDILVQAEEDLLLSPIAALLLYRDEQASRVYQQRLVTEHDPSLPREQALLDALNSSRAQAGQRPLSLAEAQSEQNTKIAPHFFQGLYQGDTELSNQAALAMLAGLQVPGMIQYGHVLGIHLSATQNPAAWVDAALERPFGRFVLLDQTMQDAAIGIVPENQTSGLAVAVSTYRFFDPQGDRAAAMAVFNAFNAQRKAAGSPPAELWSNNELAHAELVKVAERTSDENRAVQTVANSFAQSTGRNAAAFIVPTSDPEGVRFPPELLGGGPPLVTIGVARRRQPGAPWGEYLVLFVIAPGAQEVELARGPRVQWWQ